MQCVRYAYAIAIVIFVTFIFEMNVLSKPSQMVCKLLTLDEMLKPRSGSNFVFCGEFG